MRNVCVDKWCFLKSDCELTKVFRSLTSDIRVSAILYATNSVINYSPERQEEIDRDGFKDYYFDWLLQVRELLCEDLKRLFECHLKIKRSHDHIFDMFYWHCNNSFCKGLCDLWLLGGNCNFTYNDAWLEVINMKIRNILVENTITLVNRIIDNKECT